MRLWRWILLLIVLAALAAFGWHWVAEDPGYVLLRLRGWRVETTVVAAVVILLLAWALLGAAWRLARWPFGAMTRRHRRVSRQRLGDGLVALAEGRHGDAERDLQRAARLDPLRGPALLWAARAAAWRGETQRAMESLDEAAQVSPRAARVQRARIVRLDGRPAEAAALLAPEADSQQLSPGGWRELALAAAASGDFRRARAALAPLQKSGAFGTRGYAELETAVLVASIQATGDGAELNSLWSQLPKGQRRSAPVIAAYARRAARFGLLLPAMDELESALRREWSPQLVETWGALGDEDLDTRLRRAKAWLESHPNDAGLQIALARMNARAQRWSKAQASAERALALAPSPVAWETLGDAYAGQGDVTLAQRCYRNALALTRGEAVDPLPATPRPARLDTRPIAVEDRNAHGVPRLRE